MNWTTLKTTPGLSLAEPATAAAIGSLPVQLPDSHLDFLRVADGLHFGFGFLRIFGVGDQIRDQISWNDPASWRFAFPSCRDRLWFFAEDANGNQYGYKLDSNGVAGDEVICFDSLMMAPRWTLPNFQTFVRNVLNGFNAQGVYPPFEPAVKKFGFVPPDKHVVEVPHACLRGDAEADDLMLLKRADRNDHEW